MSVDWDEFLEEIKRLAGPELVIRAEELRQLFLQQVDDFVDSSRIGKLDDLLKRASDYKIKAILQTDPHLAQQYSTAADDVIRQIKLVVLAERIVASREIAEMIQQAAFIAWEGFQRVCAGILNFALKTAASAVMGPAGGAVIDGIGGFLGEKLEAAFADDAQPSDEGAAQPEETTTAPHSSTTPVTTPDIVVSSDDGRVSAESVGDQSSDETSDPAEAETLADELLPKDPPATT